MQNSAMMIVSCDICSKELICLNYNYNNFDCSCLPGSTGSRDHTRHSAVIGDLHGTDLHGNGCALALSIALYGILVN